ncbi:hypothetical protein PR048_013070 [Dryococelus australis]|uniref:DDE-1 domain-containing protein n=1 Tax=Dryococelus australis TaxID=614101 RepID=A0ABQ9HR51_9NEOP|nr:hypothetical protein PR048_013070 [Dryococelus australis]
MQAINFCIEHLITLLSLPPHASHRFQPLDVGFFGPLKKAFAEEADKWLMSHPGRAITQHDVSKIFTCAYMRVATLDFRLTGMHPFNPDVFFDEHFAPAEVADRPQEQLKVTEEGNSPNAPENSTILENDDPQTQTDVLGEQDSIAEPPRVPASNITPPPKCITSRKRKTAVKMSEIMFASPFKNSLLVSQMAKKIQPRKQVKKKLQLDNPTIPSRSAVHAV